MADRNIDQAKAKAWVADVKTEIEEVNKILVEVGNVCKEMPNENDPIVQLIEQTGTFIDNAWKEAKNGFADAWDKIDAVVDGIGNAAKAVAEKIDGFAKSIR